MLDSGIPVNTHPGGLKVLVPPPNLLNRVQSTVFGHQVWRCRLHPKT
jgi:AP-3 complex subunit mu